MDSAARGDQTSNVIEVDGLSYAYPGAASPAVNGVGFQVVRGEIFGLLGPSGAGKSTIQRILTRQIRRLDTGAVSVFGVDINAWSHRLYERVGVSFELPNHYPKLTALENLQFFASFYAGKTRAPLELLALVGLEGAADRRVETFSKGMQVRLNFVRAILHDPELLFLDEPTAGLDPTTAAHLRDVISGLRRQGKTIVLTTHNMHDADALCDRVGFIARGEMVMLDTPQNLKMKYGARQVEVTACDGEAMASRTFPLARLGENTEFLDFIKRKDIQTLHSQEASLDKVFQIVTGETLVR
ncbi:MAG: ABC transporter ATP-binding protein [Pseudomonadota bacterium]